MKPKKNRVHCQHCGKAKIQFASKQEADRFMEYNAKEILDGNGHSPVRSYYCKSCNCWHVTSNPLCYDFPKNNEHRMQRDERYKEKTAKAAIRQNIREIKEILHEINRFVMGHSGESEDSKPYYMSLFLKVNILLGTIVNCLTKRQLINIEHRIYIIKPLLAEI